MTLSVDRTLCRLSDQYCSFVCVYQKFVPCCFIICLKLLFLRQTVITGEKNDLATSLVHVVGHQVFTPPLELVLQRVEPTALGPFLSFFFF